MYLKQIYYIVISIILVEDFLIIEIKVKYHNFTKFNLYNLNKDKKDSMLEYFNSQKRRLRKTIIYHIIIKVNLIENIL